MKFWKFWNFEIFKVFSCWIWPEFKYLFHAVSHHSWLTPIPLLALVSRCSSSHHSRKCSRCSCDRWPIAVGMSLDIAWEASGSFRSTTLHEKLYVILYFENKHVKFSGFSQLWRSYNWRAFSKGHNQNHRFILYLKKLKQKKLNEKILFFLFLFSSIISFFKGRWAN